jgi:hypothetical protein
MDIKVSDSKGRFFQLTRTPQPSNKLDPGIPAVGTKKEALEFLDSVKVAAPTNTWSNVRKQLKPADKTPLNDTKIKENIADELAGKQLYIMLHKISVPTSHSGNRGARGNEQPSNAGGTRTDVAADSVSPDPSEEEPRDENSVSSTMKNYCQSKTTSYPDRCHLCGNVFIVRVIVMILV